MGTISVIITTYNQGRFLTKGLESVLSQTRKASEIVIIDDASADDTFETFINFKKKLPIGEKNRIKYLRHQKNLGPLRTFNDGLKVAVGDYLIFLPADDWWTPSILAEEAEILDRNPKIGVVYSQAITVRNGAEELKVAKPAGSETAIGRNEFERLLTQGDFVPLLTALFRKTAYEKLGGWDENLRFHADHEFWIRLAKFYPFAYLSKPLAYYRIHEEADHLRPEYQVSFEKEFYYILKKHLTKNDRKYDEVRKKAYHYYYRRLFTEKVMASNFSQALQCLGKAIKLWPLAGSNLTFWQPIVWYLKRKLF